jgi:transposase-like protein
MMKRRKFSPEFKAQVVLEVLTGVKSNAEACREYKLQPQVLGRWKTQLLEQAASVFADDTQQQEQEQRVAELERLVGRLSLELDIAKKAFGHLNSTSARNGR